MAGVKKRALSIDGYFLGEVPRSKDDSSEDDDVSDEEDFVDFSDNNIFSAKATHIETKALKFKHVLFQEYKTQKQYEVEGRLHFYEPWWAATIQVQHGRGKIKRLVGYPSYRLREDPAVVSGGVMYLLMTACKIDPQHQELFKDHLRLHGLESQLDFQHFYDLLAHFRASSAENEKVGLGIALSIDGGPGMYAFASRGGNEFFQYIPQLLPRRFKRILEKERRLIPELQVSLQTQPWMLGSIHHLFGCEASLQNLYISGLMAGFPEHIKDGLHIYEVLKNLSRRKGHTLTDEKWLPKCKLFGDYRVADWPEALKFLEESEVIVREEGGSKGIMRVFLKTLWLAEEGIAHNIHRLFKLHKENPWTFDIDYSMPRFSELTEDPDQVNAATLISQKPVVVLSGKGGCGKTTVVSAVFRYAEELLRYDNHERYKDQMFAEDDLDDIILSQTAQNVEDSMYAHHTDAASGPVDIEGDYQEAVQEDNITVDSEKQPRACCSSELTNGVQKKNDLESNRSGSSSSSDGSKRDDPFPEILLTAPTGKAANLLGKRSHLPSFTLHQVIFSYWHWQKTKDTEPEEKKWKFCEVQALIVDECSLVSVSTFHTMLNALMNHSELKKVVLLGDINQLPSIEPGYFLSDVFYSLQRVGCSAMLTNNHRADSKLLVDNATMISEQRVPKIDPDQNFFLVDVEELGPGVALDSTMDDLGIMQDRAIRMLLQSEPSHLKDHKTSQFVAFRRRDCEAINEICCKHYSDHVTKNHKKKLLFQPGDKVCCCKNATVTDVSDSLKKKEIRLCNGEIFFIVEDVEEDDGKNKVVRYLTLRDDTEKGNTIKVEFRSLKYQCKLRHAWARTIHTYQGSESHTVVYVVGSPGGQTWQHVYTAVTRGRNKVILVTRRSHLEKAISNVPLWRFTSLKERVLEQLKDLIKEHPNARYCSTPKKTALFNGKSSMYTPSKMTPQRSNQVAGPSGFHRASTLMASPAGRDQHQANDSDSDTFSDWDDDVINDVTMMESRNGQQNQPAASYKLQTGASKDLEGSPDSKSDLDDLLDDLITSTKAKKPLSHENSSTITNHNGRRKLFSSDLPDNESDDILSDLVPSAPRNRQPPARTRSETAKSSPAHPGTSPKRSADPANPALLSKRRQLESCQPVTNANISPLRRDLLGISLEPEGISQDKS